MKVLRRAKEIFDARRFDFYLLRKYGISSVQKNWVNRKYRKSPQFSVIQGAHIVPEEALNIQRKTKFANSIKFSIITPLYNTPINFLHELIKSLQDQTYSNWELCLADGSDCEHGYVGDICREYAEQDKRIIYRVLQENKGISENTNECIKLATGEYYGLLDHDDLLHPSALHEVMLVIEEHKADFIFTDEVKFSGKIEDISDPSAFNLKPGFSKYDLRSHNYICHFTVFSRRLLEGEAELYRKEFDGSQDHDMVLRLTEKADRIIHIPKVLYYWRVHSNSVSMDLSTKAYAVDAALHAIEEQLKRQEEKGIVRSNLPFQTIYRLTYGVERNALVSCVISEMKSSREIEQAVRMLIDNTSYRPLEIIYSSDEELEIKSDKEVTIVRVKTGEISRGNNWNRSIDTATGKYIVLLDSQCIPINPSWMEEMLMYAQKEDVCAVGPKIYYPDDTICYAGISLSSSERERLKWLCSHDTRADIGYEGLLCHVRSTTATSSICMMFSKHVWEELGGFSEKLLGYEDIDFCLRGMENRKSNVWTCFAEMCFENCKVEPKNAKEIDAFCEKWEMSLENEPYYHPAWYSLRLV